MGWLQPPNLMFDEVNNRPYYQLVGEPILVTKEPSEPKFWAKGDFPRWKGDEPRRGCARLRLFNP